MPVKVCGSDSECLDMSVRCRKTQWHQSVFIRNYKDIAAYKENMRTVATATTTHLLRFSRYAVNKQKHPKSEITSFIPDAQDTVNSSFEA